MIRDDRGRWVDVRPFREAGEVFMRTGSYTSYASGSSQWYDFWYSERQKCLEGVEYGGVRITGEHYMHMNYCPMSKVVRDSNGRVLGEKLVGFPDFWDSDYDYFWVREAARGNVSLEALDGLGLRVRVSRGGWQGHGNLVVLKARRKGYSYKAAACASRNYFCVPNSLTILGASDSAYLYPNGLFKFVSSDINHINKHTAWTMPSDAVNQVSRGNIRASYYEYIDGVKNEAGFMSEITCKTFADNPGAARGLDARDIFFEEAGKFGVPGLLKASYAASQDCVRAGSVQTGLITIFGTSGELDKGSVDLIDMFQNPAAYECMVFENIWEPEMSDSCGFFVPSVYNMEGFSDVCGNSDVSGATDWAELDIQRRVDNNASSTDISKRRMEVPIKPSHAMTTSGGKTFPVADLQRVRSRLMSDSKGKRGMPVNLLMNGSGVEARPILDGSAKPITSIHNLPDDKSGCLVIYEQPIDGAPKGLYKIGYDPVRQDSGTSLASFIVYKGVHKASMSKNCIVAEYVGRFNNTDSIDRLVMMTAIYYNTEIMHENEVTSVKNYFRRVKRLDLLAVQPDAVISKNIRNSKVARVYGCHMNGTLKDAGERYINDWLLEVCDYNEEGEPIYNMDNIPSTRLLDELIAYNRSGNFDLVSALIMAMMQVQEEELGKVYDDEDSSQGSRVASKLLEQYKRRRR